MAKPNRTENINLRATLGEKTLIGENAKKAGKPVGEFLRQLGLDYAKGKLEPAGPINQAIYAGYEQAVEKSDDFEKRVIVASRRMPRRAAEKVVRGEEARERG